MLVDLENCHFFHILALQNLESGEYKCNKCTNEEIEEIKKKMNLKQAAKLELTFAILKPHIAAVPRIVKDIQNRILSNGFYVIKTKKSLISVALAHKFYDEHKNKFFFNRLVTFISSGPCYFHILARENAVQKWRTMMGPTKVFKTLYTHPDTIRGIHGLSDTRNATHGSDSLESAEKEIQIFFPDFSISNWYKDDHEKFIIGNCEFNSEQLIHKPLKKVDLVS